MVYCDSERLDTPENRRFYPFSDYSAWIQPEKVAKLVKKWADGNNRPENGSYVHLTISNKGRFVPKCISLEESRHSYHEERLQQF
mgnify:CR=1 FL=1